MSLLTISNLQVAVNKSLILQGINLNIEAGELVALMGVNGSGKSTLAQVLMGHPDYEVMTGTVMYNNQDLLSLKPEERAQAGLFLCFQYPQSIAGVTIGNFLRMAYNARFQKSVPISDFLQIVKKHMDELHIPHTWLVRGVHAGFSGGEKKRLEMLQLLLLQPRLAILDETDSGLDVDALKTIAINLQRIRTLFPDMAIIVITHYPRLLQQLSVGRVFIMQKGVIIREGSVALGDIIEKDGYEALGK